jgi:lysozyme
VNPRVVAAVTAAVTAPLIGFVVHWEGEEFTPYLDVAGVPTVCSGITGKHVIPGKTYTRKECRDLLNGELDKHARGLAACLTVVPPPKTTAALVSWTYNVGVGAACGSTLVKYVNTGQFIEACNQLPRWVYAGGKTPVKGLVNRREAEKRWCLEGLQSSAGEVNG